MFELADSGSSGDLPLLCSPLSPALSSPSSLSFFYLSTCYATLCHAALAQVCGHVLVLETHTPPSKATPSTFFFLLSQTKLSSFLRSFLPFPSPFPFLPFASFSSTRPERCISLAFLSCQSHLAREDLRTERSRGRPETALLSSSSSSSPRRLG